MKRCEFSELELLVPQYSPAIIIEWFLCTIPPDTHRSQHEAVLKFCNSHKEARNVDMTTVYKHLMYDDKYKILYCFVPKGWCMCVCLCVCVCVCVCVCACVCVCVCMCVCVNVCVLCVCVCVCVCVCEHCHACVCMLVNTVSIVSQESNIMTSTTYMQCVYVLYYVPIVYKCDVFRCVHLCGFGCVPITYLIIIL